MTIDNRNLEEFELNEKDLDEVAGGGSSGRFNYPAECPMELHYTYYKKINGKPVLIGNYHGRYIDRRMQNGMASYLFIVEGQSVWIPQNCIWEE